MEVLNLFSLWNIVEGVKGVVVEASMSTTLVGFFLSPFLLVRGLGKAILLFLFTSWFCWRIEREVPKEVAMFMEVFASKWDVFVVDGLYPFFILTLKSNRAR